MLGWINPTLYANPQAFNDIKLGSNVDGRGVDCPGGVGFNATPGWDPVTGLGSIAYPILRQILNTTTDAGAGCVGCQINGTITTMDNQDTYYDHGEDEIEEVISELNSTTTAIDEITGNSYDDLVSGLLSYDGS